MSSKNAIETPTNKSPGAMLRQARDKSGVSLEHISAQTLIPLSRLIALENEDFERVGGAAYVVGYARNAAETIGVDPKPIVDAYTALLTSVKKKKALVDSPIPVTTVSILPKKAKAILTGVGAAFILVIITLIVLLTGGDEPSEAVNDKPGISSSSIIAIEEVVAVESSIIVEPVEKKIAVKLVPQVNALAVTTNKKPQKMNVALVAESLVVESVTAVVSEPEAQLEPEMELESATKLEAELSAQEPVSASAVDTLSLFFTDECWVQVTDLSGKRLVARVANSGDHLKVEGLPPFDVMLGNAKAVLIELNNESVEIIPRRGKRTLRLSVGG